MGDTWGISGPAFLILFLGATGAVLVLTLLQRRHVYRGPDPVDVDSLGPQQLAFLTGGRRLAMQSSLVWLRHSGAVSSDSHGMLTATPTGAAQGATELDRALLHAVSAGAPARTVISADGVRESLNRMEEDLIRAGLVVGEDTRRSLLRGPWLLLLLTFVGFVRFMFGVVTEKPVLFLFLIVLALVPTTAVLFRRPVTTKAAGKALKGLRVKHAHLAPAQRPAFDTYGPASTAMAVGLFGGAVLWQADPALAMETQAIADRNISSSSTGGSCGSASSGGGGGDGGGGGGCGGGGGGGCGG